MPEQRTTGDQSPSVSNLYRKDFCFHRNWNGEYEIECTQRDRMAGMVAGYHKETKGKGGYLEKYPFFYWEPVELFERWCNILMFAFAKKKTTLAVCF